MDAHCGVCEERYTIPDKGVCPNCRMLLTERLEAKAEANARNAARWEAARKVLFKQVASETAFRLVWKTVAIDCKAGSPEEWADRLIAEDQE